MGRDEPTDSELLRGLCQRLLLVRVMDIRPGMVGVAHTKGVMGRLIRFGEMIRFRKGCYWNHMFIVGDKICADGHPNVIQATLRGVTDTASLNEVAPHGIYSVLSTPEGVDEAKVLEFAKSQVGIEYGFWTIIAIAIDIVTWNWVPAFRGARKQSWICSALAMEAYRFGGWIHSWIDIYSVTPAEGFEAITERTV